MMQTFRNNMKIIFFILIFFFVGWMGVTLTGLDEYFLQQSREQVQGIKYAGMVDEEPIDRATFDRRVQQAVDMASSQRPNGSLSPWEIEQIREQVWSEMVNEIILSNIYSKREIDVTDPEVVEYIRSNPMPELTRLEALQTDGRFDYDKYLALIADPRYANFVLQLEQDARKQIPTFKLFLEVSSLFKLTDAELKRAYRERNETARVNYIAFKTDSLIADSGVEVSQEEIKQYYREHEEDFFRPEVAAISYFLIPLTPGPEDSAAVRDSLLQVMEQLEEGAGWDTLAMQYSQDPVATSGGDLGWFGEGDFSDGEMVDKALSMSPGEISDPVATSSGYQIIRVDSTRRVEGEREVKARRILMRIEAGRKRTMDVRSRARAIRRLVRDSEKDFTAVAADSGFTVRSTGQFALGSQIPGIDVTRELLDYIYSADEGDVSYPIEIYERGESYQQSVMLAKVEERKKSGTVPLDEAESTISRILMIEKKKPLARQEIEGLMEGYAAYDSLAAFAEARDLELRRSGAFTRLSGMAGIGRDNEFVGKAFGLPVGERSGLFEVGDNFYVLEVVERTEADMDRFEQTRERLAEQIRASRMQNLYALFTSELQRKTEIEDLREIPLRGDSLPEQAMK